MATRTRLTRRGQVVFGLLGVLLLLAAVRCAAGSGITLDVTAPVPRSAAPVVVDSFEGTATLYGPGLEGGLTASGQAFDAAAAAAAHPSLPFGTQLRVTDLETGRSVRVVVNDRLPAADPTRIDLTVGAAAMIGLDLERGRAPVRIEVLG